jgi:hypothetical protein
MARVQTNNPQTVRRSIYYYLSYDLILHAPLQVLFEAWPRIFVGELPIHADVRAVRGPSYPRRQILLVTCMRCDIYLFEARGNSGVPLVLRGCVTCISPYAPTTSIIVSAKKKARKSALHLTGPQREVHQSTMHPRCRDRQCDQQRNLEHLCSSSRVA